MMWLHTAFTALALLGAGPDGPPAGDDPAKGAPAASADEPSRSPGAGDRDSGRSGGKGKLEVATFGAGCFWSTEAVFERIPGVVSVVSGFSGGWVPDPTYPMVCTGNTGHAESVQVVYDPKVVPYETLLTYFWKSHDPTTPNMQGDDVGPQYRSVIFYHTEAQRQAALKSYQDLTARRAYRYPIVTELVPMKTFYPAEPYHQDYFQNHRGNQYSTIYIEPKLRKLKLTGKSTASARKKAAGVRK